MKGRAMEEWMLAPQIAAVFAEEIQGLGGTVTEVFDDKGVVFCRSVLPKFMDAGPDDRLQPGVALRATENDIMVHPYIFRLVCSNGAIMARALQSRQLVRDGWFLDDEAEGDLESTLRVAIRQCCQREAFNTPVRRMKAAGGADVDMAIVFSAFLSTHRGAMSRTLMREILLRYGQSQDRSAYGLLNAVTSVARDSRDPQTKWRLEVLGGEIAYGLKNPKSPKQSVARSMAGIA
jgi:hypothetical protein